MEESVWCWWQAQAGGKEGGVGQERVAHTFLPLTTRAMLGSRPVFADRSVQDVCKQCARSVQGVCKRCARGVQGLCKKCAGGVQGRPKCASSTPGGRGVPDSPPGRGWAHLAGISSFISSPINSQIGCHHRLSIHHFGGREALGRDLTHPKITLGSN